MAVYGLIAAFFASDICAFDLCVFRYLLLSIFASFNRFAFQPVPGSRSVATGKSGSL